MSATIEILALELLCSRLCHDLISPVTAVANGVELLMDDPTEMAGEVAPLLAASAGEASRRLQFYRTAYGFAGGPGATIGTTDAAGLLRGLLEGGKIAVDWPDEPALALSREAIKVILNALLVGAEALPRGGRLSVRIATSGRLTLEIVASGEGAKLHDEVMAALDPAVSAKDLGPRSIQAYFAACLARASDGTLAVAGSEGEVRVSADIALGPSA